MPQITLAKTIELEQAWMAKDEAMVYFGYRHHKPTFQKILREFKEHKDFKDGYRLVTSCMPIIHIQKFDEFLIWRDKNKYRMYEEGHQLRVRVGEKLKGLRKEEG